MTVDQRRLVEQARHGDHDAFAELVRGAVARLDTAARLILRDPELARDAVQEGLFRAWRDLRGLRDPDRFDAWIYRLTVNACLDLARRRRRRPIEVEITPLFAPSGPDPAIAVADRALVDSAMRRLDEQGRAIVVLHYFVGMPLTEVAASLRVPVGTVKSRLHRALGDMRSEAADSVPATTFASGGKPGMSGDARFERALPGILEDLGAGPTPDYTELLLARTAATSQRPGWMVPERWYSMSAISERLTTAPRIPMRTIGVVALLILVLVAAALIVAGQRRQLPLPYGPAGNGLVVYASESDIYVGDPVTRNSRRITSGPEVDGFPGYTKDGTKITFLRSASGDPLLAGHLMIVDADGSGTRAS